MVLESAFHKLFCLKCSFKLVTFSKGYEKNESGCFFLNTVWILQSSPLFARNSSALQTGRQTDGRTDGQTTDGQTDKRTERQAEMRSQ